MQIASEKGSMEKKMRYSKSYMPKLEIALCDAVTPRFIQNPRLQTHGQSRAVNV